MAFPYLSEEGFEAGTVGHFDADTDTETRSQVYHYTDLAAIPGLPAPYRGAYCYGVNLANDGTPADSYLQETGSWDTAASGTIWFRFLFWVSPDITMANADEFAIFQLWSATNTVEGGAYINYTTANGLRIGIGETSASSFLGLTTGQWHCLELKFVIDSGAGNDGTLDGYLDGAAFTQVATLDQGAITSGVVGVLGQDAGTTKGYVLFDEILADDARIFPPVRRFAEDLLITKSGHVFVGPGRLENASLLSGAGTDNVLSVYDTDVAYTSDAAAAKLELKNTANNETVDPAGVPVTCQRGCYVALSGTNPRAIIKFSGTPAYGSDGAIRSYGTRRKPASGNV